MKQTKSSGKIYVFFTLFYAYFILALFECARGNFIPFFIEEFSINNSAISLIISISQFGSVIGCFLAGNVSQKLGQKVTFIIGTTTCAITALLSPFVSNITLLCIFYFTFNFGRSFLCISVDSIVPMVSLGYEVLFINLTHLMYGIGSFAGQNIYGNLLFNNVQWRTIYFVLGFLFILSILFVFLIKLPQNRYVKTDIKINKKEFYKNPVLWIMVICFSVNAAAEGMMTTWFINYMNFSYKLTPVECAKFSSIFFMTFSIGRLAGGFVLKKIGTMKGLKIFMAAAAIMVTAGLILRRNGLLLIALAGLFFSVTYPTLVLIINKIFKEVASLAIGIVTTLNALIYIIITIFIGILNDTLNPYITFFATSIFMTLALVTLMIADKKTSYSQTLE